MYVETLTTSFSERRSLSKMSVFLRGRDRLPKLDNEMLSRGLAPDEVALI